ncbi:MAG: hypothetical protein ACRDQA_24450 [Nocardioidaceae bacterium]
MLVKMTHPMLPGREIEVPENGVAHRERAGWRRADSKKSRTVKPEKDSVSEGEQA